MAVVLARILEKLQGAGKVIEGPLAKVATLEKLTVEVNASFTSVDARTRVETPMSLRTVLDRLPAGLRVYAAAADSLRRSWEEFVLPHIDPFDRDHYETVWAAVVRRGPEGDPYS